MSNTSAERAVWMAKTTDAYGSHMKTDMDSYLALIRRKIQERCATTQELIQQIRRNKISDSAHVTPNEFRFTLIKFGIILPQTLVDRIFQVFDSDRSGTMDFDEFAMWIMNSEFRPAIKATTGPGGLTALDQLRIKLSDCVKAHPRVFEAMCLKKQMNFMEFVSDINRTGIPLTEKEARSIFQQLDPRDKGVIESAWLTQWAETGKYTRTINTPVNESGKNPRKKNTPPPRSLKEIVAKVVGWNTPQLQNAFAQIKMGSGTRLPFDEFRRALLNGGAGRDMSDFRMLYNALGGQESGGADVDLLFATLDPAVTNPATEVSAKHSSPVIITTARADRHLREAFRKCHKELKYEIEKQDSTGTGYIAAPVLYKIVVKRCIPLTYEDFRFVLLQIRKEPGSDRVDYNHFLHAYSPTIGSHQLSGLEAVRKAAYLVDAQSSPTRGTKALPSPIERNFSDDNIFPAKSAPSSGASGRVGAVAGGGDNPELKKIWQSVLRECHRADPDRSGQVNRTTFISALEKSDINKTLTPESMNALADSYTMSNGLVNYLLLFRQYLNDMNTTTSSLVANRSMSLPIFTSDGSTFLRHDSGPVHPWEFTYKKRTRHTKTPYWQSAVAEPKGDEEMRSFSLRLASLPPASEKNAESLDPAQKELLLSQFQKPILELCAKCYAMFAPVWRQLRNKFRYHQINSQRGSILTTNFLSVLEEFGLSLKRSELGLIVNNFRGQGMQDIVKYDEFLRVCMLLKDRA